jgi:ELWxxDGT repeat protein
MSNREIRLALIAALLLAAPLSAAPHIVNDWSHGPPVWGSALLFAATAGEGVLYFPASDPAHGFELWRSDGTTAGTYRLTDVCPGRCDSSPTQIFPWNGEVYWSADDGVAGRELWASDGIPGHERRVKDICPGPCDSNPESLTPVGNRLLFFATLGRRRQLWGTDGTAAGTTRVTTLCTVPASGQDCAEGLLSMGSRALFQVLDPSSGGKLWVTDGTAAGTQPLANLATHLPDRVTLASSNGSVAFFFSPDALWKTDGTGAGTTQVAAFADVVPGETLAAVTQTAFLHGVLYFLLDSGDLIRSDGTPQGTIRLARFPGIDFPSNVFAVLSDRLVFAVNSTNGIESFSLWQSQGTPETTTKIADFGDSSPIREITSIGSRAVFQIWRFADTNTNELWVTDGTVSGTGRVPFDFQGGAQDFSGFFAAAGLAFFNQTSLAAPAQTSRGDSTTLWATEGTASGTLSLHDFGAGPGASEFLAQVAFAGKLLYSALTPASLADAPTPLFVSDGTAFGTVPISQEAQGARDFLQVGEKLFFGAGETDNLWQTDGTPAGTVEVSDVRFVGAPKRRGQEILFPADPSARIIDLELYRSDGTAAGTALVKDINPFYGTDCMPLSSNPTPGTAS